MRMKKRLKRPSGAAGYLTQKVYRNKQM